MLFSFFFSFAALGVMVGKSSGGIMAQGIEIQLIENVAVLSLDYRPANFLTADTIKDLNIAFDHLDGHPELHGVVLTGQKDVFSGGLPVDRIGQGDVREAICVFCTRLEQFAHPVVALLSGMAQGCGAELALAADFRIATPSLQMTFPDIALGLVPAAGGSQRLPRLVGAEASLHLLLSSQPIQAPAALAIGLVDDIAAEDPVKAAIAFLQGKGAQEKGLARDRRTHLKDGKSFLKAVQDVRGTALESPLVAPAQLVECIEAAVLLPFEAGLTLEQELRTEGENHPQSLALRHIFQAERRIDSALLARNGSRFEPVIPMGKSVVAQLWQVWQAAADAMVEDGWTEEEIDAALVQYGFARGPFGGDVTPVANLQIERRMIAALMSVGARLVEEQAVQKPSDLDALAVHGMGYPRRKGGPIRAAQTLGLIGLRQDMRQWCTEDPIWAVPPLLDAAIKDAKGFDQFDR